MKGENETMLSLIVTFALLGVVLRVAVRILLPIVRLIITGALIAGLVQFIRKASGRRY